MKIVTSIAGARSPKLIRRTLPIYLACVLALLLFTRSEHFSTYQHSPRGLLQRVFSSDRNRNLDSKFPKKIWQTWKIDPLDFDERDSARARTWVKMNPGHRYEVLTDDNALEFVEEHFGPNGENRPDILDTYRNLNATIIKADLLRYLIMYIKGGVYADIDTEIIRPINVWIPEPIQEKDVGFIISVEIDEPNYVNHTILGPKSRSFCQWTFACKPRQPVMMRLIDHVLHWLNEVAQRQNVPISDISLNFDEVITGTGPSAFTDAIMAEMAAQVHRRLSWDVFHSLSAPLLVGNILVMTVEAFAAGQGHSNSGSHDSPYALVRHHYHASKWPSRHPRYSHPAYGMVEECNWAPECVKNWTENTAVWDSLPEDRKAKLIADKEVVDKERFDKEEAEKAKKEKEEVEKKAEELKKNCEAGGYYLPPPLIPQTLDGTQPAGQQVPVQGETEPKPDEERVPPKEEAAPTEEHPPSKEEEGASKEEPAPSKEEHPPSNEERPPDP